MCVEHGDGVDMGVDLCADVINVMVVSVYLPACPGTILSVLSSYPWLCVVYIVVVTSVCMWYESRVAAIPI